MFNRKLKQRVKLLECGILDTEHRIDTLEDTISSNNVTFMERINKQAKLMERIIDKLDKP